MTSWGQTMKIETFAYLATPYAHKTARIRNLRAKAACRIVGTLMKNNIKVFSPIVHNHQLKVSGLLKHWSHDNYMTYDAAFIATAHSLIIGMLPGWEVSVGVGLEQVEFRVQRKPIFKYDPNQLFSAEEWSELSTYNEQST